MRSPCIGRGAMLGRAGEVDVSFFYDQDSSIDSTDIVENGILR